MFEEQQEAPADDADADAGGDDAVDLADLGGAVETADEPAVTAEELMEIPDAPETPGPEDLAYVPTADDGSDVGAQAAADDAGGEASAADDDAGDDDSAAEDDAGGDDAAADDDAGGDS